MITGRARPASPAPQPAAASRSSSAIPAPNAARNGLAAGMRRGAAHDVDDVHATPSPRKAAASSVSRTADDEQQDAVGGRSQAGA